MKVSEAFLVNTKNFAPIIETLVNHDEDDIVVNSDLLERLSYSDPNDLLVIRILKDFSIIDNDGKPGKYFKEFKNPETTKIALAKGLVTAYEGIFDEHPDIHQLPPEKIKEVFENYFKDKKTVGEWFKLSKLDVRMICALLFIVDGLHFEYNDEIEKNIIQ